MIDVLVTGAAGKMGSEVVTAVTAAEGMRVVAEVDLEAGDRSASEIALHQRKAGIYYSNDLERAIEDTSPDVAVDFTHPKSVMDNIKVALNAGVHCVVGTTGIPLSGMAAIEHGCAETGVNCFIAPNFAIGAVLMMQFSAQAARYMGPAEIVELHHDKKADAPSGTAKMTAKMIDLARPTEGFEGVPCFGETLVGVGEGAVQGYRSDEFPARGLLDHDVPIHSVRLPGLVAHQEVIFGGVGQTLTIRHDSINRTSFMPGVVLAVRKVSDFDPENRLTVGLENLLDGFSSGDHSKEIRQLFCEIGGLLSPNGVGSDTIVELNELMSKLSGLIA